MKTSNYNILNHYHLKQNFERTNRHYIYNIYTSLLDFNIFINLIFHFYSCQYSMNKYLEANFSSQNNFKNNLLCATYEIQTSKTFTHEIHDIQKENIGLQF